MHALRASCVVTLLLLVNVWACNIPDCGLNVTQLIESKGYTFEQHYATTDDGYILSLQRIPHGLQRMNGPKPPVLLMHGLLDCAATWVMNFPEQSLGFILADAGFDVWLGNWRGNTYSLGNTKYGPETKEFWDFTCDEMARYDLQALLDYVAEQTGFEKILYVGHSQGTLVPFMAASMFPNATERIALFVALAPVAYIGHVQSPVLKVLAKYKMAEILKKLGTKRFLPSTELIRKQFPLVCQLFPSFCADVISMITGNNRENLNNTRYQVYTSIDPAGTSVKSMMHYSQNVNTGLFNMYDYGSSEANMAHYGRTTPPPYLLHNVKLPTALFYGGKDILADPVDVQIILDMLPPESIVHEDYQPSYAHMDYVWGINARELIYPTVVKLLQTHAPTTMEMSA